METWRTQFPGKSILLKTLRRPHFSVGQVESKMAHPAGWAIATLLFLACATLTAQVAPIPSADALPGRPFAIRNTWIIGGVGNWDYLTLDATARQLFVAHGTTVQVVDVDSGSVIGTVKGFREAHQVVLDGSGGYGYVTDGGDDAVKVFDRGTYQIVANIPTGPRPRSLVLEPASGLMLAICSGMGGGVPVRPSARPGTRQPPPPRRPPIDARNLSTITLIDTQQRQALANVLLPGRFGFAQADGNGQVFVTVSDRNRIARLDAQAMGNLVTNQLGTTASSKPESSSSKPAPLPLFDWSGQLERTPEEVRPHLMSIGNECEDPRGLAVDGQHNRVFVACSNMKMAVVNTSTGSAVASLTIGPGADAIAYDANRGLIFTANGGGYGSVTIISQSVTDSYAVVQNLPTLQQARTMAVDPSNGNVYLVTSLFGAKLGQPPMNGIGTLKMGQMEGSFQVLVVGN